jgi:hypothetical protein
MPIGQPTDGMTALRNKIASLELTQRMELLKRDQQAAWEKRDRKAKQRDLELKMRFMEMKAALGNEKRDHKAEWKELEQKAALDNEKRDHKAERKELEQNAALENEKRERMLEKKEIQRQFERENEKRENEKRDRKANELEQKLENEKRERMLENEKRDRDAALEKKETQHQIERLRWEARLSQMEQQLAAQPRYSQPIITSSPIQRTINPSPTLQGDAEQRLLQQLLGQKVQTNESSNPSLAPLIHTVQSAPKESTPAAAVQPLEGLHHHTATIAAIASEGSTSITAANQPAQAGTMATLKALPAAPQGGTGPTATLPSAARPPAQAQAPTKSTQEELQRQSIPAHAPTLGSHVPSKTVQSQRQVSTGPTINRGSVPLPEGADTHFFLSHCQATGGDQTNAIYLELRQLGFSCW